MVVPYLPVWPQALALMTLPPNVPTGLANLLTLVDDVCYYAGDRSVDVSTPFPVSHTLRQRLLVSLSLHLSQISGFSVLQEFPFCSFQVSAVQQTLGVV